MVLNPDLPSPNGIDDLRATGRRAGGPGLAAAAPPFSHVFPPFDPDPAPHGFGPPPMAAARLRLVVTLHDLIPRVFPDHYHADPGLRRRYLAREELIRAAD